MGEICYYDDVGDDDVLFVYLVGDGIEGLCCLGECGFVVGFGFVELLVSECDEEYWYEC